MDVPPPPEQTFPSQTPPIVEPSPSYTLPVEIFRTVEKAIPIFVHPPEPVYAPIPMELPPQATASQDGAAEIGWAALLLGGLTLAMFLGARRHRVRK